MKDKCGCMNQDKKCKHHSHKLQCENIVNYEMIGMMRPLVFCRKCKIILHENSE